MLVCGGNDEILCLYLLLRYHPHHLSFHFAIQYHFLVVDLADFIYKFNRKNSSMLCIGVNKIKIHFDTSQLCCGVVHFLFINYQAFRGLFTVGIEFKR
jgi:hypothetical protein